MWLRFAATNGYIASTSARPATGSPDSRQVAIQALVWLSEGIMHAPKQSFRLLDELPKPDGDHAAVVGRDQWKRAIQGYLAANVFADAQIGRILDAYEQSKHRDNTILCLWSDHGWHLGEKDHWRKFSL